MKKYSKVFINKTDKNSGIRYNYTKSVLESVSKYDINNIDVLLTEWVVYNSIELDVEDWEEDNNYHVEQFNEEMKQECKRLLSYL